MKEKWDNRRLGKTNLFVASLCWGGATIGNLPEEFGYEVSEEQAIRTLLRAFESPVNFFDTASIYNKSEKRIGKTIKIKGGLPEGVVIATKADRDTKTNEFSAGQIRKSVMNSCEFLGIKPLPLVYLHDPEYDPKYRLNKKIVFFKDILAKDGPVAELEKLKEEGIVLNIGISGGPIDMLLKFIRTSRFDAVITHNRWNLLWQVADSLIEEAYKMGIGVVNAAPYASGILAAGHKEGARVAYQTPSQEIIERVEKMKAVCQGYKIPLAAAALQFSLRDDRINSTIVGVSSPEQVEETLRLARLPIPDRIWEDLNSLSMREGDPETNIK